MLEHEKRTITMPVEARAAEGEPTKLAGYAAVFNQEATIGDYFREVILPGAFAGAITRDDVRAQFNHDSNLVLGRTKAGTLVLREDETGLAYEISPPDTSYARDLMVSVARGDVSQSSFMFDVTGEAWEYPDRNSGQLPLRKITGVKLYDVAPVTFPAYEGTSVSARAMALKDTPPQAAPTAPPDYAAQHLAEQLALDAVEAQG
jgi:HK97 family phage prohead protease